MTFVKYILAGLFALFVSIDLALAGHPPCGCSPYPAEGTYGTSVPFSLTYVDGDADTCPTKIRLQARRQDAPNVDVTLTCNGPGEAWTGDEYTPFGSFSYSLRPQRQGPGPGLGGKLLEAAIDYTEALTMTLSLSRQLIDLGKTDRTVNLALQGRGKPPPCMCTVVRKELEHVKEMQALYSDQSIIQAAESANLRGSKNNENMWMDDQRKLQRFDGDASNANSYKDLVSGTYRGEISVGSGGIQVQKGFQSDAVEKAQDYSFGKQSEGTYASTHPISCKVSPPTPSLVHQECSPNIVVDAAILHEKQHAEKCESLNSPSTYTTPDGTNFDWSKSDPVTGWNVLNGITLPRSGYDAWIQNVKNHAKDEADAYAVEVSILSRYLSSYCN